mgnify:CR=1 FL=1
MSDLVHELVYAAAARWPDAEALVGQDRRLTYRDLAREVSGFAQRLLALGLGRGERVAVYLDKSPEAVAAMFGAAAAGGVFVPVNPLLKAEQVGHILRDCAARVLVTSGERMLGLMGVLEEHAGSLQVLDPSSLRSMGRDELATHRVIDTDIAAILYTSGSTGRPKGVVLSHRNLVAGARSVATYLENTPSDRILAVLPFSFDYGLSQLTTAFYSGACVVLMNYLFPRDIVKAVGKERITGLAAVPPLWNQLAALEWPAGCTLRYVTNSGGAMPRATLDRLRRALPAARPFLMYGLTEAFRSTYLPPAELDRRPDSIGKAIPNAEVLVVREDGTPCAPNEPGELVHRGALVALGYWNDPVKTAERFRPAPGREAGLPFPEIAVWSGDTVRRDEDGFFYFVGRRDEMIKVSGYRVSPTEVEEVLHRHEAVAEAVALGVPHPALGQAIVVLAAPAAGHMPAPEELAAHCRRLLPAYMAPAHIEIRPGGLPRNPNGKIDRAMLRAALGHLFQETDR